MSKKKNKDAVIPHTLQMSAQAAALGGVTAGIDFAATFAPDYTDIKNIRFFRVKNAHNWVLPKLRALDLDDFNFCTVLCYTLTFDAKGVKNILIPLAFRSPEKLLETAINFFIDHDIGFNDIQEVITQYTADMTEKKLQMNPENSTPIGGQEPSLHSQKHSDGRKNTYSTSQSSEPSNTTMNC